jgi:PadR family transcriptional regulator, regulatory protein PadR
MKQIIPKENEEAIAQKYHDQIVFDLKRGFLQFVALVLISKGRKYAYEIKADILQYSRGGFDIDRNNLYKKLRSLERDGILKSQMEPSLRGAQRKYYTLTTLGKELLAETHNLLFPLMKSLSKTILKDLP